MRVLALIAATVYFVSLGVGCASTSTNDPALATGGSSGSTGGAGQGGMAEVPSSLEFEMIEELPARAQISLKVRAKPAKVFEVRFALPASGGDPLDAVLDQATAYTDADGIASVTLTAPSAPATFNVRANVGSKSALLTITVKDSGFATVQVQPRYAGFRPITTWVASAYRGMTCAKLPDIPDEDGPIRSLPAAANAAPQLMEVPAGESLAVTLRSGHFVGGCASVEKVAPGPIDKPQIVQVTVLDRPIDLSASPLAVSFGLGMPDSSWSNLLQTSNQAVVQAFQGTSLDDVDALLDAMREASGSSLQLFENTRTTENWDGLLRSHWGANAASKLRDASAGWFTAGRQKFAEADHLFTGTLMPIVQSTSPLDQRSADFTLLSVADLDGSQSGFVDRARVSWSASSGDTLVMGTDLYFVSSELLQALAEASALAGQTEATSAAELLATQLDCAGAGAALAAAGANALFAYDECDGACLTDLCQRGVAAIWQRGGDATGLSPAHLSITATGAARVGDTAEVVGVLGSWLGELTAGDVSSKTGGVLTGVAPVAE
jgi:hypothetical protein